MHPFPSPMMIVGGALQFVGQVDGPSSGGPATFHADAQAGDLGVIIVNGASVTASGWADENLVNCYVLSKRLETADLSGVSLGGSLGAWGSLVYRGAHRLERAASVTESDAPLDIPGFTKAGARGLLLAAVTSANMNLGAVSGFTTRQTFVTDGGFRWLYAADMLPAAGYTNGADIVWTGSGTSGGSAIAFEII